jgi:uncharacterized protein
METTETMKRSKQGELCWVDLTAKDLDPQTAFYESLFGWKHEDVSAGTDTTYRLFTLDGALVAGAVEMPPELGDAGTQPWWNAYFAVDDVDDRLCLATGLGGQEVTPPTDLGNEGRMAGIQDPTGALFSLWQAKRLVGAERFGEPGTLMWADLMTRDPQTAIDFYPRVFPSWKVEKIAESSTPFWTIGVEGTREAGIMPIPDTMPAEVPPNWQVYLGVEDARGFVECAQAAGASVVTEPMDVGSTVFAVLADPMGAVFAVMQPMTGM